VLRASGIATALIYAVAVTAAPADGGSQIDQLLRDRPNIAPVLQRHAGLTAWLIRAFVGEFTQGHPIRWRNDDSNLGASLGKNSHDNNGPFIVVSSKVGPIDQLMIAIYECLSAQRMPEWDALWSSASSQSVTKREFVLRAMRLEHEITLATKSVVEQCLRLTPDELVQAPFYQKVMHWPDVFDPSFRYYESVRRPEFDARDYYGSIYDGLVSKGVIKPAGDGEKNR
jgi:hypothetical protein